MDLDKSKSVNKAKGKGKELNWRDMERDLSFRPEIEKLLDDLYEKKNYLRTELKKTNRKIYDVIRDETIREMRLSAKMKARKL